MLQIHNLKNNNIYIYNIIHTNENKILCISVYIIKIQHTMSLLKKHFSKCDVLLINNYITRRTHTYKYLVHNIGKYNIRKAVPGDSE